MTMTTATTTRKPASKRERFAEVLTDDLPSGSLLIRIVERGPRSESVTPYFVAEMPADFGGRAFSFAKFAICGGETYHVSIGDEHNPASCSCPGHTYGANKGIVCKHLACVRGLIDQGKL
jgi:hypothetical protein